MPGVSVPCFAAAGQQLPTEVLAQWLGLISQFSTPAIFVLFGVHLAYFLLLWLWYRRDVRQLASTLDSFTREIRFRSVLDRNSHLCDQIEAFLSDINEVLEHPERKPERAALSQRVHLLDERRSYLQSMGFETAYSVCRTMIETYPIAGILGTIIAIGVVLQAPAAGGQTAVQQLVQRFGEAIWSTFAGLVAAIVLMMLNSFLETSFTRLTEDRRLVRDTVLRVKRALSISGEPTT